MKLLRILTLTLLICGGINITAKASTKNNILFILVDDLGYGDLSCYNPNSIVKTTNIDKIAASGIKMTQSYSFSCSGVSSSAFLTGRFPQNIGVYSNFDAENPGAGIHTTTFVSRMQDQGYTTAWVGKWSQGWDVANHPLNNGFDKSFCFLGSTHSYVNPKEGAHRAAGEYSTLGYLLDDFFPATKAKHLTEEFTDRAINIIADAKKAKKPYFLTLAYNAPHTPYQSPVEMIQKYKNMGLSGEVAARSALIEHLDNNIGRLLESIDTKNTLVVFTSDNGGENERYNGGLKGAKNSVWEGGIKVPMIASFTGVIPSGISCNSLCSIVDLSATFANTTDLDGVNLMPYFKGEQKQDLHETLLFVHNVQAPAKATPRAENAACLALRKGKWKIMIEGIKKFASLYDIEADCNEKVDVSSKHPELLIELTDLLYKELEKSQPASAAVVKIDYRKSGDIYKADSLRRHCLELLKKN